MKAVSRDRLMNFMAFSPATCLPDRLHCSVLAAFHFVFPILARTYGTNYFEETNQQHPANNYGTNHQDDERDLDENDIGIWGTSDQALKVI